MLSSGDIDYIDPGAAYYQVSYITDHARQRPDRLGSRGLDGRHARHRQRSAEGFRGRQNRHVRAQDGDPVLAAGQSDRDVGGGRQVRDRARAAARASRNGYVDRTWASSGFGDAQAGAERTRPGAPRSAGITTPDDTTLVIKLTDTDRASESIGALRCRSAPVPEEYAKQYDAENPSTYGEHQVATGPYMIENNATASSPATRRTRRSTWSATRTGTRTTDYRPAYLDEINIQEGFADTVSAGKKILSGSAEVNGDFTPPPRRPEAGRDPGPGPADPDPERWQPVHHAEHDEAAVRRHQRPQGGRSRTPTAPTCATRAAVSSPAPVATHFIPPGYPRLRRGGRHSRGPRPRLPRRTPTAIRRWPPST